MPKKLWYDAINEAEDLIKRDVSMQIQGYDIDGDMIKAARQNAEDAGVLDYIHFQQRPVSPCIREAIVSSAPRRRLRRPWQRR